MWNMGGEAEGVGLRRGVGLMRGLVGRVKMTNKTF